MCAAVVLKKAYPDAEVHFAHAALIRSGIIDVLIDEHTVTVDLPFHPKSGWYLDHHLTNKPTDSEHDEFTMREALSIGTIHHQQPGSLLICSAATSIFPISRKSCHLLMILTLEAFHSKPSLGWTSSPTFTHIKLQRCIIHASPSPPLSNL